MWHVYIIECADKTLYTGVTTDITRRLKEHNDNVGARYTRPRLPVRLVYQKPCRNRSEALKREARIKRLPRAKKISVIKGRILKTGYR